ncbi:MAG: hypothetical protein WCK02_06455 [Bacteroidota bacterium]
MRKHYLLFVLICLTACNGADKIELKKQALLFYKEENYLKADSLFSYIKPDTLDFEFFFKRGFACGKLWKINESNYFFDYCINHKYKVEKCLFYKGLNCMMANEGVKAIDYFQKVLLLDSANINAKHAIKQCKENWDLKK